MKLKLYSIAAMLGAGLLMANSANAQWTRNAGTQQTYLDNVGDNVGIGTTNPAFKLDIQGTGVTTMSFKSTTDNASILLDRGASNKTASLTYRTNGVNDWQTGCVSNNNFTIRNNSLGAVAIFCDALTNKIGMGTNLPGDRLSIMGGALSFHKSSTSNNPYVGLDYDSITDGLRFRRNNGSTALNTTDMFISRTTGNVGIGTSTPTSLLQVGNLSGAVATPTAITMDNTYSSVDGFDKLKFYLYKSATESYGLGLGTAGDMQYWAGGTSTGTHRFFTSQQERMRISANGNVGIGTSTPIFRFTTAFNGGITNTVPTTGSTDANAGFRLTAGIVALDMGVLQQGASYIQNRNISNFATSFPLSLQPVGGNVGIGINAPEDKLHVNGGLRIGFGNGFTFAQNASGHLDIDYKTGQSVLTTIMTMNYTGGVAIGTHTVSSGYQLTVAGAIICTALKVQLQPFPDYVFASDYKLKSISEVEDHIKTYNRLPGMPSACEVEENGMDVGTMQGKVVEKVEELTLYIIQQQKQMNEQQKQIDELKALLNSQKK